MPLRLLSCLLFVLLPWCLVAQRDTLALVVVDADGQGIYGVGALLPGHDCGTTSDFEGRIRLVLPEGYPAHVRLTGVGLATVDTVLAEAPTLPLPLKPVATDLNEVVVSGTLTPVRRSESPIPVEVYSRAFLLADRAPSLFEAMQNVNGVRPQVNCGVCATGDIRVNGLPGPYTLVTIDGMPIVSGLGTVYGLAGIPTAMIERVEVVKGPAGSLYGSESIGGLINVITRDVDRAPRLALDLGGTGLGDVNLDAGVSSRVGRGARVLTSANGYYFDRRVDGNGDGFTDQVLSRRLSVFQKWSIGDGALRGLDLAGRVLAEARWGGQLDFDPARDRGGERRYGEAIDTRRGELLMAYRPAAVPGLTVHGSFTAHRQRSDYGTTGYNADQRIGFAQATMSRKWAAHEFLFGLAARHTYYDDDTPATAHESGGGGAERVLLPGAFVQDEYRRGRHRLLTGLRYDYDARHGAIWTPRLAYKMPLGEGTNLRLNLGTGFRVVSLFTEDHAALSGARRVVLAEGLRPERSVSLLANVDKRVFGDGGTSWTIEASAWYTRFANQILPDYLSDAAEIRYANLGGHSRNRGASGELRFRGTHLGASAGVTFADVAVVEDGRPSRPLLTERWSGVWGADYTFGERRAGPHRWAVNYTASLYGPMLLPTLGARDPRPAASPWWSLQNVQLTYRPRAGAWELYGGVKNLLDFRPRADAIARSFDPFDRGVTFDAAGDPVATPDNPGALVFDPSYVYASNVGRRAFLGARLTLK